jgi:hypothetical protein
MLLNKWVLAAGAAVVVGGVAAGTAATLAQSRHSAGSGAHGRIDVAAPAHATPRPHVAGPDAARPGNGAANGASGNQPGVGGGQPVADKSFATKTITVQGVTFEVPTTWGIAPVQTGPTDCLTIGGVAPRSVNGASNCQLTVQVVSPRAADADGFDPDTPYGIGAGAPCGANLAAAGLKTVQAADATVGGSAAEFRAFTADCLKGTWEQWTVPTAPGVILVRSYADPATEPAARYVVAHAQLPAPRSALRLTDRGIIRSVTNAADGVHIALDRVTRIEPGGDQNLNPATYNYVLPANLKINSPMATGGSLTAAQLVQLAAGHTVNGVTPPLSTLGAYLHTDGATVTSMDLFVL